MKGIVIFDGKGYFVRRRRPNGRVVDLWSPRKKDAARFYIPEAAQRFAATFPQKVEFRT